MGCTSSLKRPRLIIPAENSVESEEDNGDYNNVNIPKYNFNGNITSFPLFVVREEVSALEESAVPSKAHSFATSTLNQFNLIKNNV
ncbi:unnamed protein product [Blepharisma stoltei]|uniref:Uncharacterized protein n=1 Tax=Blepharisma stoltei TaxID=1481888 RepID=A0AAU9K9H9_9CILI|nr:unnamed protein product [Blepharisma stoltei]